MELEDFRKRLNTWGHEKVPFLFLIDFELKKPRVWQLDAIDGTEIRYDIDGFSNGNDEVNESVLIRSRPITLEAYKQKFDVVHQHLAYGDSYLTNLTIETPIELENTLLEIFQRSSARYKFLYKDEFLVFSPESFIKIQEGRICAYPMKGTIDAATPNAAEAILNDRKELAEHVTIVDLIRNDLSVIAKNVQVRRFRYLEEVNTNTKKLLQVSSEIIGEVEDNWSDRIGDILLSLLPAGSISGAPKNKTVEIISTVEKVKRGYFTGVVGYFDGQQVDSGVLIRYIEKKNNQFYYRSGGGITAQSIAENEYLESIDKVYVPIT